MAATTFNPSDKALTTILSGGNLVASTLTTGVYSDARTIFSATTGKFYAEFIYGFGTTSIDSVCAGLAKAGASLTNYFGSDTNSVGVYSNLSATGSDVYYNAGALSSPAVIILNGSVVCQAVDLVNKTFWFRVGSGNWNGSGTANPATNTGGISISGLLTSSPAIYWGPVLKASDHVITARFDSASWGFTPPSGFSAFGGTSDGVLAVTGTSVVATIGRGAAASVLAITGTSVVSFVGRRTAAAALSITGTSVVTFVGRRTAAAALSITSTSAVTFVGQGAAASALSISATSTVLFSAPTVTSAVFSITGTSAVSWTGRSVAQTILSISGTSAVAWGGEGLTSGVLSISAASDMAMQGTSIIAAVLSVSAVTSVAFTSNVWVPVDNGPGGGWVPVESNVAYVVTDDGRFILTNTGAFLTTNDPGSVWGPVGTGSAGGWTKVGT